MGRRGDDITLVKANAAIFLAPEDVGSTIQWQVEATQGVRPDDTKRQPYFNAYVTMRDCSDSITMSAHGTEKGPKHMLKKLDALIDQLQHMRQHVKRAQVRIGLNPGTPDAPRAPIEPIQLPDVDLDELI